MLRRRQTHRCGTHPDEWADDPDAYHATVEICPGCQRYDAAQADLEQRRKHEQLHGAYVTLRRGPEPPPRIR